MAGYKYNPLLKKNLQIDDSTEGNPIPSSDIVISDDIDFVLLPGNSFGNLTGSGTIVAGTPLQTLFENVLIGYLVPTFSSFALTPYGSTLEIGTDVGGFKTATWGTTNPTNVLLNSVNIFNTTGGNTTLLVGSPNDGTQASLLVLSGIITASGWTFTISATNTALPVPSTFQRTFSINGRYRYFHGAVATIPTDSAGVRALPVSTQFAITSGAGADSITLNTGTNPLLLNFTFAVPAGKTLVSVIDLDAANANLTSSYILATYNVDDANSVGVPYKIYSLTIAVPYSSNHRHQITLS